METRIANEIEGVKKIAGNDTTQEARLKACVEKKQMFVDLDFPPTQESLSRPSDIRQISKAEWARPRDYLPDDLKDKVCVFNNIEPEDIDQGALGDCWLLCAIAALAEHPDLTKKLFRHPVSQKQLDKEIKAGAMRVTLNRSGWWTNYITDTYLPIANGAPCFAKNVEDPAEQWVSILEKVYAKANGSYSCITAGDALQAFTDLTGFPVNRFDTEWDDAIASKEKSDELFAHLLKYDEANYLINLNTPGVDKSDYNGGGEKNGSTSNGAAAASASAASTSTKPSASQYKAAGLGMGHAYSVLTVKHFPQQGFKLLKIRNPWGGGAEWNGKWGDNDDMWKKYPAVAKACKQDAADDGCFWMDWESVKEYFSGGGVCFSAMSWFDYRVRGAFTGPVPSAALEITVTKPTKVFLTLTQKDKRSVTPGTEYDYAAMMLSVCKNHKGTKMKMHLNSGLDADEPQQRCYFTYNRDQSMLVELLPEDGPYLVVPRCWGTGKTEERPYVLGIISETAIQEGQGISVRFKQLDSTCKAFKNYDKFAYVSEKAADVECECQHTPILGAPFEKKLTGLGLSSSSSSSTSKKRK